MNKLSFAINRFLELLKNKKHYVVMLLIFILLASLTMFISFAYFKDTSTTGLIVGKVGQVKNPDVTIKYMVENRNASGSGTGTYTENYVQPVKNYTFSSTGSGCTNGATYTKDNDNNFKIVTEKETVCEFYFNAVNINTNEDFDLIIKKERKKIDGSGSGLYEEVTNTSISGLIFLGYKFNSTKSTCTSGSEISYNPFTQKLEVENNASSKTCTAFFDATTQASVYFYIDNGGTVGHSVVSTEIGGSGTNTFTLPSGVSSSEAILTCDSGITAKINGTNINLEEVNNSGVCIIGLPKKFETLGNSNFNVPIEGFYKLETWGAEGGLNGGKGGYATGVIYLTKSSLVSVTVGSTGSEGTSYCGGEGVNGGGCTYAQAGGGGGASDVRLIGGGFEHRVIVAGGGGGKGRDSCAAGAPANVGNLDQGSCGIQGGAGSMFAPGEAGFKATDFGNPGEFGLGAAAKTGSYPGGAGGGGWFGGGSGFSAGWSSGGGGGSNFVFTATHPNSSLTSRYFLKNATTFSGVGEFLSPSGVLEVGHSGNGFVKITLVGF